MKNRIYQTACESVSANYFPEYEPTGMNTGDEQCVGEEVNVFVMYW